MQLRDTEIKEQAHLVFSVAKIAGMTIDQMKKSTIDTFYTILVALEFEKEKSNKSNKLKK